jgi:hypothetical protein
MVSDSKYPSVRVTIFGSCRQDALFDDFMVNSIRENLTYPHYPKEIIQAINYCRGFFCPSRELASGLFRYPLLHHRRIRTGKIMGEFNKTDIFAVEIASRIEYIYKGHYCHHIATDSKYGFNGRDEISIRDATDAEIECDLRRIKELLFPKPFFIISHFYTRNKGKRYELVRLLERICLSNNIPFLDPVLHFHGEDAEKLYKKEAVVSHYTPFGHELIRNVYLNFIEDNFSEILDSRNFSCVNSVYGGLLGRVLRRFY